MIQQPITSPHSYLIQQLIRHSNQIQRRATIIPSRSSHSIPRLAPLRLKAGVNTPRMRTRSERTKGRQAQRMLYIVIYVFYCLCNLCYLCYLCYLCHMISTGRKTHKPRGRASDISTISTCIYLCYDILPTPPPISVRTAGGITVVYLCGF